MPSSSSIGRRLASVAVTAAMMAASLVTVAVLAPTASADPGPILQRTAAGVTADALPTTQIDGVAWTQQIVGNTVYVGGKFANARPAGAAPNTSLTARPNFLAYDLTTGLLNPTINPAPNAQVFAIAASPDGKTIYIGGSFTKVGSVTRNRIAAINASTGAVITTFAAGVDYTVKTIVATTTTVYVGGAFGNANGAARPKLAAFSASNGTLTGWNPRPDAGVNSMVLSPDGSGKLIVGGEFQNVNGAPAYGLAAVDGASGALLPWNATSLVRDAGANSAILALSTDGTSIFGSGYVYGAGGNLEGAFSADPVTGNINYLEDCHGDTYGVFASSAAMYTISHDHYCGNVGGFTQSTPWSVNMRHALAFTKYANGTAAHDPYGYYDFYGTPVPSVIQWYPEMDSGTYTGLDQAAWSITGNDQYILLGGEFPTVNGVGQQGLVRFAVKPIAPGKQGPQYKGSAINPTIIALPTGARVAWQANSDEDDRTLSYTLTRNNVQIYQTNADSAFWSRQTMGFIDKTTVPGALYKYRLTVADPDGNTVQSDPVNYTAPATVATNAYAKRVVADGAAPYWPMDEASGKVLFDNAGFNDADVAGSVVRGTTGAISGDAATTFDGSTATTSTRTSVAGPNTFTAQAWINTTTTAGGKILGFGGSPTGMSGSYDRQIYMDNAGHVFFGVYPNAVATINSAGTYNNGQWHQITATLGPDGMKLYVDDKLVAARADVTFGQTYQGYWRVGGDNLNGWNGQPSSFYFTGAIDEVAVYPTVLTRQTVDAQWVASGRTSTIPAAPADPYGAAVFSDNPLLYWRLGDSGTTTAKDSGPAGDQTGIYQNGVTLGAVGGIKGTTDTAASFDGVNDFVASSNSYQNPMNYSLEAWFKTTSTSAGKIIGFGDNQTGLSGSYDRHVYLDQSGKVNFGVWTGQTNVISSPTAYNDGQWHQVVATQSGTTGMALYLDGTLVGTNPQTSAQNYTGYWKVGGDTHWASGSPYLNATIDDVAVYNSVLSASQVGVHFNLGNTVVPKNHPPVAAFTSTATFLTAQFDGTGSTDSDGTVTGYQWNFGDGSPVVTGATPSHTYSTAATYPVSLTVTDNSGDSTVLTQQVTVTAPPANVPPTATFSFTTSNLTVSLNAAGSADSDGTIAGYAWDFGDNTTGTGLTATHTYTAAGSHTITLTVTDNGGGTGTTAQVVTVTAPINQAPVASFVATAIQLNASFDGSASSDPDGTIASYSWDFGDGSPNVTSTTSAKTNHAYAAAGSYSATLTVTDNQGASTSSTQPLQVTAPPANQPPSVGFHVTTNGLTANVESTSTDPDGSIVSYAWDFGDGETSTTAAAVHTFAAAGSYSVKLTVTDNSGASSAQSQDVTVTAPPPANVPPTAAFSFTTSALTASVNGSGSTDSDGTVVAYSWNFGDGSTDLVTTATASHTFAASGTYPVALTVTDNSGATNTVTQQVTVSIPVPTALINDTFTRTVSSGWGSADTGGAWTVAGGAANFSVGGGTGKVTLTGPGAGPSATIGAPSAADVNLSVDMSLNKAPTGGGVYLSLGARKVGTNEYRVTTKLLATGVIQLQLVKVVGTTSTSLKTINVPGLTYSAGDTVSLRFQVSGSASVALNAKLWKTGTTEPTAWTSSYTDSSAPLASTGGVALYPYMSGTSSAGAVVASYDNLKVLAVTP